MRARSQVAMAVTACALALVAGGAVAQISPFRAGPGAPRLARSDMDMLWKSAAALNHDPAARPGSVQTWHNPQTGDSGSVTLFRAVKWQDLPCHDLRYVINVRTESTPRRYDVTWCRTEEGEWKIAP